MTDPAATSPAIETKDVAPAKSKLGRSLMFIGLGIFMLIFLVFVFGVGGSDLGQGEALRKKAEKDAKAKEEAYAAAVTDPEAAARASVEDAEAKIRAKNASAKPAPGVPLPSDVPTTAEVDPVKRKQYDAAVAALRAGKEDAAKTTTRSAKATTGITSGAQGSDGDSRPVASFLSYADESLRKETRMAVAAAQKAAADSREGRKTDTSTGTAPGTPSDRNNALIERQLALQEQAVARAGTPQSEQRRGASDENSEWLYAAQARKVENNKPLQATITPGRYVIFSGTVVPAVLITGVDTKLPGRIVARVTQDVYDSRYGKFLVIPRGSVLTGQYRASVQDGQNRVLMAYDRLTTPAGGSVALGNMAASDIVGMSGVPGELHTNFLKRMGIATLLALESAVLERKVGPVGSVAATGGIPQATSSGTGQIMVMTANAELQRQYAITPHITIEPGSVLTLVTSADIEIPKIANLR